MSPDSLEVVQSRLNQEVDAGWNEFVLDTRERENVMQYTGDRPAEVEWTLEE